MNEIIDYGLELPGTPFSTAWMADNAIEHIRHYSTKALMSLEDSMGKGQISDLIWWHPRHGSKKELCHSFLRKGYSFCDFRNQSLDEYGRPKKLHEFKDITELHNTFSSPSIVCGNCKFHIFIQVGFEGVEKKDVKIIAPGRAVKRRPKRMCRDCMRAIAVFPNGNLYKHRCKV